MSFERLPVHEPPFRSASQWQDEHRPLTEPLLKPADAAALLNVRPSWVYESVRTGRLPCLKLGRHVRFLRQDLETWLLEQRVGGRP